MPRAPDQVLYTQPCDLGFGCVSRKRGFTVFLRRDCGKFLVKPQDIYDRLMMPDSQLEMNSVVIGAEADVQAEQPVETATRLAANDFLTLFELKNEMKYQNLLDETRPEESHFAQSYVLDQNPDFCSKTSSSGVFNTFTHKDKIVWLRGHRRRLLAKEKFIAMGFPMTQDLANIMGCPVTW